MTKKTNDFSDDKKIIIKIINEELFNLTDIFDYLENNSIYWNDDFFSVQLLLNKMINEFIKKSKKSYNFLRINTFKNTDDKNFAKKLFSKTIKLKDKNISVIHELAKNWDIERISTIDSILLQLAITEMTQFESIPYKVSINEYIEIAKTYSTKKSHEFINGILDAFLKKYFNLVTSKKKKKMKHFTIILCLSIFIIGCNTNATDKINSNSNDETNKISEVTKTSPELVFNDGEEGPEIKFDMEVWEFGEINEGDVIDTIFTFTNVGKAPLIISNAKAGCGCTVPQWPKDPIGPGETGEIAVKFNSKGKPGPQNKPVTLTMNTTPNTMKLRLVGKVNPSAK